MKDQLARRAHLRLWAEIKVSVCESADRSESDAVHHIEVFAQCRKRLLVHRFPLLQRISALGSWLELRCLGFDVRFRVRPVAVDKLPRSPNPCVHLARIPPGKNA